MGLQQLPEAECSLNDSNIDNRNQIILKRSREMVQECNDLGMSFANLEDQLCVLAERILRHDWSPGFMSCVWFLTIILSWNVHGAGNPLKCHRIKDALTELQPDWIGIQKSKLNVVDLQCIAQLTGWQDVGFAWSPTNESAGVIICCWNLASIRKTSRVCQSQFVSIKGSWVAKDAPEVLICVYAPTDHSERIEFLSLASFVSS